MDAPLVVAVEDLHCLDGFWDRLASSYENAIDVKSEDERIRYLCSEGGWGGNARNATA